MVKHRCKILQQEFLDKILNVVDEKADLIGGALGFVSDPVADGRGLSTEAFTFMMDRVKHWKLVNPLDVIQAMFNYPQNYPIMSSVTAAAGGWFLNEIGGVIDPKISKVGRAIKKIGVSSALGMFIGANLWLPAVMGNTSQQPESVNLQGATIQY